MGEKVVEVALEVVGGVPAPAVRVTGEPSAANEPLHVANDGELVNGPHVENWTVPVGAPVPGEMSVTVAMSDTEVPGLTLPVGLAWVASVVWTITWKHSLVRSVDADPTKLVSVGVYAASKQ